MDITHTLPEPRAFAAHSPRASSRGLRSAGFVDTLRILFDIALPNIAKGVIIRRPAVLAMAEWLDIDRRGVRRMQRLRAKHGTRPLMIHLPGRTQALIFDPADAHRVLEQTPRPFTTASAEKRAALTHFEPKGALITLGPDRTIRRQLNEQVLQSADPVHPLAEQFTRIVEEEARCALNAAAIRGALTWDEFAPAWFSVVRRVVFGDGARHDHAITETMAQLRRNANWAFLWPQNTRLRDQLLGRIRGYIRRAEPGSLASLIAARQPPEDAAPEHQIPQWLFAFDPAGMATFRSLALLATHAEHAARARREAQHGDPYHKPMLRATVLESLRLWPTTPLLLRETTEDTAWGRDIMPAGTGVLLYAPYFHRDNETQHFADRFEPDLWMKERTTADWPLMPFSSGPAVCPGRHLVLMLTSTMLGRLMDGSHFGLRHAARLDPARPMPASLSHFRLRFDLRPRSTAQAS